MLSLPIAILLLAPAAVFAGHRVGRYVGRKKTVSWRPIFQLVDHRMRCLGHPRARLEHDLGGRLAIPPRAWAELLAPRHPLERRPRGTGGRRP